MPFTTIRGLKGKVYIPETVGGRPQKHPCRECFACQNCGNDRCRVCLNQRERPGKLVSNPK